MVQGKFYSGQEDLAVIKEIRKQVFKDSFMWEDEKERLSMHAVVYADDRAVGTGRIFYDGWECIISHVGVLKAYRGRGLGDFIVRLLIDKAVLSNVEEICLTAGKDTFAFFEKIGFKKESGKHGQEEEAVNMRLNRKDISRCCDCHEN